MFENTFKKKVSDQESVEKKIEDIKTKLSDYEPDPDREPVNFSSKEEEAKTNHKYENGIDYQNPDEMEDARDTEGVYEGGSLGANERREADRNLG